ncbi:TPA: hypothetical protein DEO28_02490 [Candidatus Dependentiae bacterium]|nr:MAG: hypothetical protein UR14_C0008G0012 [candidate division TM6 bacterium GW2011_GWE2_31_21]KKP53262.1 MAG: hypothetical protein UR43_C0006G0045 [candidate division TM6 bacterium GW2011_GWF2_33_332]HBS48039.1 hypothetical protein [Candidatus Dependentiae bacterium]HBZ73358.1 hypothetical protein [Candidatus Dependentiae bacterium]
MKNTLKWIFLACALLSLQAPMILGGPLQDECGFSREPERGDLNSIYRLNNGLRFLKNDLLDISRRKLTGNFARIAAGLNLINCNLSFDGPVLDWEIIASGLFNIRGTSNIRAFEIISNHLGSIVADINNLLEANFLSPAQVNEITHMKEQASQATRNIHEVLFFEQPETVMPSEPDSTAESSAFAPQHEPAASSSSSSFYRREEGSATEPRDEAAIKSFSDLIEFPSATQYATLPNTSDTREMPAPAPRARLRREAAASSSSSSPRPERLEEAAPSDPTRSILPREMQSISDSAMAMQSVIAARRVVTAGTMPSRLQDRLRVTKDDVKGEQVRECPICSVAMIADNATELQELGFLPCAHFFHFNCIHPWVIGHHTCPTCRRHVEASEILRIMPQAGRPFVAADALREAEDRTRIELERQVNGILERLQREARDKSIEQSVLYGVSPEEMQSILYIKALQNSLNIMMDESQIPEGASLEYAIKRFFEEADKCRNIITARHPELLNLL